MRPYRILHGLEKFHHYYFSKEVCGITDHKKLGAILSKDVVMLSQQLQCMMLRIHQYRVQIIFIPGPDLYTAAQLSWITGIIKSLAET